MQWRSLRDLPGVLTRDLARYRQALSSSGRGHRSDPGGWISLCNRREHLEFEPGRAGARCDWQWGSELHAPRVVPQLGRAIMRESLAEWPIEFAGSPRVPIGEPALSFVIAHSGSERIPQLLRTISTLHAQQEVPCEVIVVDQSPSPLLAYLPAPVVYRHLDKESVAPGWRKSWAYNVGARLARAPLIIFHDGDVCAPSGYAREVVRALRDDGFGAASLQRFLYYLDQKQTSRLLADECGLESASPVSVFQNWKGGTIAVERGAFAAIGGFDEGFVDWGGEDDEFYDRCGEIGHCRSGFLPFVHLWHQPQALRWASANATIRETLPRLLARPRAERVMELVQRAWGNPNAPDPLAGYS